MRKTTLNDPFRVSVHPMPIAWADYRLIDSFGRLHRAVISDSIARLNCLRVGLHKNKNMNKYKEIGSLHGQSLSFSGECG